MLKEDEIIRLASVPRQLMKPYIGMRILAFGSPMSHDRIIIGDHSGLSLPQVQQPFV